MSMHDKGEEKPEGAVWQSQQQEPLHCTPCH